MSSSRPFSFADAADNADVTEGRNVTTRSFKPHDFLCNLALFQEMNPGELDRIASGTRASHIQKGEILFHKGDPCTGLYIVVYGQIKLAFPSPQGTEKVVEIIGPGLSFGEALMFMERPYIVFAQALADSMLLHVAKECIFGELDRDVMFARRMLAGLARRLHGLVADVESYSLRSGTQRVIGFLLRCDGAVEESDAAYTVTLPATKATIASRLNLTPEHFSRILHELIEAKLIEVHGRDVRIPDPLQLRSHIN